MDSEMICDDRIVKLTRSSFHCAKTRCNNPKVACYANYGGRGIRFLFESFEAFVNAVGYRPSAHYSLDRIDNNGHYEPGNVRWATRREQSRNRPSYCISLTLNGRAQLITDWARELGMDYRTLTARYHAGWSEKDVLTRPLRITRRAKNANHNL